MSQGSWDSQAHETRRLRDGARDVLVREEPLVLDFGARTLVTMRSPGQEEELVLGFLLGEGLIDSLDEVQALRFRKGHARSEASVDAVPDRMVIETKNEICGDKEALLSRMQELRPSCGLCGITELETLVPEHRPLRAGHPPLTRATLSKLLAEFKDRQKLFHVTGGSHAAAIYDEAGSCLGFGEDIGRHNALDKAIGAAAKTAAEFKSSTAILSGRAGYELVAKLLRVGCPCICSLSAASSLSFDLCRDAGATLIGFAARDEPRIYWDEGRFVRR